MNYSHIIKELETNATVFIGLFSGITPKQYLWRQAPEKWCLLEIVCHLVDEELEDFRARVERVLYHPQETLPPFNPVALVKERKYIEKNYNHTLNVLLEERAKSVQWLRSLENPQWENAHLHATRGPMSAKLFLSNWLAHDHLHIRQIIKLKFDYLKHISGEDLTYAGPW